MTTHEGIENGSLILVNCSSHRARRNFLRGRDPITHAWCFGDALPGSKGGIYVFPASVKEDARAAKGVTVCRVPRKMDSVFFGSFF
jgi:hypothetical protein